MWKYIRKYLFFAIAAGLFMTGEVMMDLLQPGFMSRIVDDGVLGVNNGGSADLHLIWMLGLQMIGLVLLGGLCGSLNNVFVHISSQNIENEIRKDCFRRIMQEDVSGIRIMKACVRKAYEKTRFGKANGELVRTQLKTLVIFAFMNPLTNAIMYIAVTVILLAGSFSVGNGRATPGDVMAALTYTTQLLNGVLMLVMLFQNISRGLTSWKRVKEVLESVPELLKLMIRWTVIVGLVCTVLFEAVPSVFIRMFGSADDPVYYDFAVLCLRIYLSLILVTCAQKVCAIFLQSIGKAKAAAPLSVLRDVLLVVFSLLIPVFLGVTGIFLAAPVADVIAILATVAVMVQVWKEK